MGIDVEIIKTYENISDEHAMEVASFQQLRQLDPVLHIVEVPGPIAGVAPQSRRLMAAARLNKRVDDELLVDRSWSAAGFIGG